MALYTEITHEMIFQILGLYRIKPTDKLNIQSLPGGITNTNYKVGPIGGQSYLLKISNDKDFEELHQEHLIYSYIKEHDRSFTLAPLPLNDNTTVFQIDHICGALYPFINSASPIINEQTIQQLSYNLALLHTISTHNANRYKLRSYASIGQTPQDIFEYVHNNSSCPQDFKELFLKIFPDQNPAYLQENFPQGLIHGDLYIDNVLFHEGKLQYFIDFEQAGLGELNLDIGISISGSCFKDGHLFRPLIQSFIKSYEQVRKLEKNERHFLNESILMGLFSITLWRIKRFKEKKIAPDKEDIYKELLIRAENFYEDIHK